MSMIWQQLGRSDYDDATLLAEYHERPAIDKSAWIGLRNVLAFYACGGGLVWIVLRIFR